MFKYEVDDSYKLQLVDKDKYEKVPDPSVQFNNCMFGLSSIDINSAKPEDF